MLAVAGHSSVDSQLGGVVVGQRCFGALDRILLAGADSAAVMPPWQRGVTQFPYVTFGWRPGTVSKQRRRARSGRHPGGCLRDTDPAEAASTLLPEILVEARADAGPRCPCVLP